MSRFIKLTNMMLNTNTIKKISIMPNKYSIHLHNEFQSGFGIFICGSGFMNYTGDIVADVMEVCENADPINYKIITDWIYNNH